MSPFSADRPDRRQIRWYQFTLGELLLAVVVCSACLAAWTHAGDLAALLVLYAIGAGCAVNERNRRLRLLGGILIVVAVTLLLCC